MNAKKRDEFQRMINDCHDGKIDLVITKSISRFARNTVNCLNYTRALKNKNIGICFEKEKINTLDAKGEVLMTIMASLARQESESLSANVRLGLQFRYQQGKVQGRYALSGIVFCAHCGDIYRRIKWNNRGCKSTVWRCVSRVEKDGPDCPARTVLENSLKEVVVEAINAAFREKEKILPVLAENIKSSLEENTSDRIAAVDDQIKALQ